MIKRASAIFFILLANIMLLAHSFIIHHHDFGGGEITIYHEVDNNHSYHNESCHQHNIPTEDEHNKISKHHHEHDSHQHFNLCVTGDLYYSQLRESNISKQVSQTFSIILFGTDNIGLDETQQIKHFNYNLPFLITSIFKPQANALRGPPLV